MNQNLLKPYKDQIFGQNLPMRRSIIVNNDNSLFMDLDKSISSVRKNPQRKTQVFQPRRSSTVITGIIYPSHNFFARKLKRIVEFHLRTAFKKLQNHRKCRINFDLLQSKTKRFVSSAFFTIQLYSQLHKGSKLGKIIEKNKKPDLIFSAVGRTIKTVYKQTLERLRKFQKKRKNIDRFCFILDDIIKNQIKKYYKKMLFRKMKFIFCQHECKDNAINNICRLSSKIIKRIKVESFRSIFSCLKKQQLEQVNSLKRDFTYKMNETTSERSKVLNTHRESIRNIKNNLDFFSADRSKARYQIKRDIGVHRSKLKEDQKKAKTVIGELLKQISQIQNQLAQMKGLNYKRLQRLESPINQKLVREIYYNLSQEEANKMGETQPKMFTKQKLAQFQNQVQKLDEYHIYKNQKLRQQVFQYEGLTLYKSRWPEQDCVCEENWTLKQLIQCIIQRSLEKILTPFNFQDGVS